MPFRAKTQLRALLFTLTIATLAACSNPDAPTPARVQFTLASPFCGPEKFGIRFMIDSVVAGADTLSNGQSSPVFLSTPGAHHLSGAGIGVIVTGDTTVTLRADSVFTAVVNIYCS
jgi:hypothetical protein